MLTNKINSGIFGNQAFVEKSVATDIIPEELDNVRTHIKLGKRISNNTRTNLQILLLSMACPKYDQLLRDLRNNPKDKLDYGDIYKQVAVGAGEPQVILVFTVLYRMFKLLTFFSPSIQIGYYGCCSCRRNI